jgi:hypothetical protein
MTLILCNQVDTVIRESTHTTSPPRFPTLSPPALNAEMDRRCPLMQAKFDKHAAGYVRGRPDSSPRSLTTVVTEAQPFHGD